MQVKKLNQILFDELIDCFLKAFDDYFVKMPTDKGYYQKRWEAAGVDFNLSYGMFDDEELVGFIIHAIDERFGIPTAFNTGTGVIPAYRGQRIVKSIYDYALSDLKKNGIQKSILEVITNNDKAVLAYKGVGFKIRKEYKCYAANLSSDSKSEVDIKKIRTDKYDWSKLPHQEYYSWDFQKETILRDSFDLYEVMHNNVADAYFIIHPEKKLLAQFDVFNTSKEAWERLFKAIGQVEAEVKIINVDTRLTDKMEFINLLGLENTIDQFEMELEF
ncbi:GNAT family N-acetyltransferase [Flammeovirga yaeyamensis]|uniref:GNAT family N-acetyltransferase n=1 Tax=Flammeovirga yaeyamensis TaxID=367791 RepID=A0AAX1NF08_9BACT|nr:GNAT family N-acetyltransferase [Flammeovirga yaeyamensis]MBB3696605.1 ribosomal protein S18 acetylase RimI-like enzyme [Flammeovirga yaeyamensis]NMF33280.1 GNAT family N-acetyltransferase [Flammeovirga yaeyamensis]QWG05441.1 GNAT family N-acetyltransferase [Flammeovirga yaeyamensis]